MLVTNETGFARNGMLNFYNIYIGVDINPHSTFNPDVSSSFQLIFGLLLEAVL
jgi:hypothetical protein